MKKEKEKRYRLRYVAIAAIVAAVLVPTVGRGVSVAQTAVHNLEINSNDYKAKYGKWDMLEIPEDVQINAIHSVMLPTGKVLLIAGSGNNREQFEAGTFVSLIYDPETGETKQLQTPVDMFCAGHAFLPNGNLLVAGGTQGYEVLKENLTQAGGTLTIRNEDTTKTYDLPKGTLVTGTQSGLTYRTVAAISIPPAVIEPADNRLWPEDRNIYVESTEDGKAGVWDKEDLYTIDGIPAADQALIYGIAPSMSMEKKEYEGINSAYEFNPWTEQYQKVDPMHYARWYPTLTGMSDGHIMAISGLDSGGRILDGQTEIYDPSTHQWTERKDLRRFFPTYPAIFQTAKPGVLFSAGPSTGWGPEDKGRDPGFWTLDGNTFDVVKGLRDPGLLETASVAWLGPVNNQRLIVVGGGGVGQSNKSTGRIDVIDLDDGKNLRFKPLGELPQPTRYPNVVTLPTGDMFITNGSKGYRGMSDSNILKSYLLDYEDETLSPMADPQVGRNYHSSALLLPNGQILTAGSDPLFGDKDNTTPGQFERRIEIYSPPYLFTKDGSKVSRPVINSEAGVKVDGDSLKLSYSRSEPGAASDIASVHLVHPGAVTHVTDTNQRLINLDIVSDEGGQVEAAIPKNPALVPPGYYMLFLIDSNGVPSLASWVQVGVDSDSSHNMQGMNVPNMSSQQDTATQTAHH